MKSSAVKRLTVQVILPVVHSRGERSASWPAMLGRPLVIVGTPNQRNRVMTAPPITSLRRFGCLRSSHIPYTARNGQTSGRPRPPSTPSQNAQRRRPPRYWSIAARQTLTSIESDWALIR